MTISKKALSVCIILFLAASIINIDLNAKTKKPTQVKNIKITKTTYTDISVKWKKAKRTNKYYVYYSVGSKYKLAGKTKKTSYTIKKLKSNHVYKIRVRAIKGKKKGKFSKVVKSRTLCKITFVYKSQNRKTQKTIKGVKRGGNVTAPSVKGYTYNGKYYSFTGWDKSLKNIKGNTTITAKYKNTNNNPFGTDDWYWAEDDNWYKALMSGNKEIIDECLNQMNESYCASDNKDDPKKIAAALKWTWKISIENRSDQELMPFKDKQIISYYDFDKTFREIKSKYNITKKTPTVEIAALTAIGICDKYDYGKGINQLICAGYSNCYQYCMNRFGVPCYYASTEKGHGYSNEYGDGHAWNIVKINDKYYNVDVTEIDKKTDYDGKIVQRYNMCYKGNFLKSTKYMIEADESASDFMPGDLATHYLNLKLPIQCTDTSYDNYDWSKEYENVF